MLFDDMRSLLARARNIAIVGAKDKPGSPVDHVGRYLLNAGFNVKPVHAVRRQAWGIPAAFAREGFRYLNDYKLRGDDPTREGRALIVDERELPAGARD